MNERHVRLTRLERLPRAMVYWAVHIIGLPLFLLCVPLAFAWVNALEAAEAVNGWMNRRYWH